MDKKSIYIIVAVVIVAAGIWLWLNQPASNTPAGVTQQENVATGSDNTASINQDLNSITVEDPDFKSIDTDLNSL